MNITHLAIENNRTTLVLLVVLLFAGVQAFMNMPRAYDPGFIIRTAQVITYFPGASPKRMEQLVTDKVEEVTQEIPELDFVKSESRTGVSIVMVNIKENYKNMRPIWDNLRRKIEAVADDLPDGSIGPIVNDEFGDVFGIVLGLSGEGFTYAELKQVADEVRSELLLISEVAKVDILGAQEERIYVEYDNARLAELNISPSQLLQILSGRNIINPGGSITLHSERIELEPTGNFETINDIRHTIIQIPGSKNLIYLSDIANVERGYVEPAATKVRSTGIASLGIAISMREGGNNILLGQQVKDVLNRLQYNYPIGLEFDLINFSPDEVAEKVSGFVTNLLQAIIVVAAVMLVTLGLRTGLIVATLIPFSMIITIFFMSLLGIGLDQISLAALIIALGMLVDNGIVMSENIQVQISAGKTPLDAAVDSANELRVPLLTSSLTTAAAFLPIFLAESSVGEFTASLFKVVTITLLVSWLLSLTIIPMLCMYLLKPQHQKTGFESPFYIGYKRLLHWILQHKAIILFSILLLFASAIYSLKFVPKIFFPPSDRVYFKVELELPLGTSIEETESMVKLIEQYIERELKIAQDRPDGVTNWVSYIGSGGTRFILPHNPKSPSSNYALMIINTSSAEIIGELMRKLDVFLFNSFPDLQSNIKRIESGAAVNNPVEVRLFGKDENKLFKIVDQLKQLMSTSPMLKNISDDWGQRIKKLIVKINQPRALRAGVSSQDIAVSLQTGLSGLELTQYRENDDVIPVIMRSQNADQKDIRKLKSLVVYAQSSGESVPLKQVADVEIVWEPAKVLRRDRLKTVTVAAQLNPEFTAAEGFKLLIPWLDSAQAQWDIGYRYELGGEAETSGKGNQSIAEKLPVAAFIIILLLVMQFNSFRKPLIILLTIPLAIIGVVYGLLAAQSFFGFMTLLGIISLAGIVINNAIVLLERIQLEIEVNKLQQTDAIVEAAQRRIRPILLTTATTVLGLIPLYLGGGEMWEPLTVAIISGLLFSTVLTLAVVPILYSLLFRQGG